MFSRLSISARLWATTALLGGLIVAIGLLAQFGMQDLSGDLDYAYSNQLASSIALGKSNLNLTIVRTTLGSNAIETALSEIYEPPLPGYGPRGGDIDADGVYWVALASGHVGSFDRNVSFGTDTVKGAVKAVEGWSSGGSLVDMSGAHEHTAVDLPPGAELVLLDQTGAGVVRGLTLALNELPAREADHLTALLPQ